MFKKYILKVFQNNSNKQKLVTIPKDSDINNGDYVQVKKVEDAE
jgi:hypothetical protein